MALSIRNAVNNKLRRTEPFLVVTGSVAASVAAWLAYQLLTSEEDLKHMIVRLLFKAVKSIPGAEGKINEEKDKLVAKMEKDLDVLHAPKHKSIPERGFTDDEVIQLMTSCKELEGGWRDGKISGVVYAGSESHMELMNKAYSMFSYTNPLHPDVFPSVRKFESEVIAMTAAMLGGNSETVGATTSGGTESILMALKAYRDQARILHPDIKHPEVVVPVSAHAAFDKGGAYFGLKIVHVPVGADFKANIEATKKAITRNTILLVGSAPSFPQGMIDPIEELAAIARQHKLPLHVDACLGGFLLPWLQKLGYPIPNFDFRVSGVTSISADTHKYGYAAKGTSVLLFKDKNLRKHMYFVQTEWPGGIYASPGVAGSRPGGLIAACYAALLSVGQDGYLKHADAIGKATQKLVDGIKQIPGLEVLGDPKAMVVAFTTKDFNIFKMVDALKKDGWVLNVLQKPNSLHLCLTQQHVDHIDEFLRDLRAATELLTNNPSLFKDGVAPVYGLATGLPERSVVKEVVYGVLDAMLKA